MKLFLTIWGKGKDVNNLSKDEIKIINNVLRVIPSGAVNAVSSAYVESMTGLTGRDIRRVIDKARLKLDVIIAGDERGYYMPSSVEELRDYYAFRKARTETSKAITDKVRRALKKMEGGVYDE